MTCSLLLPKVSWDWLQHTQNASRSQRQQGHAAFCWIYFCLLHKNKICKMQKAQSIDEVYYNGTILHAGESSISGVHCRTDIWYAYLLFFLFFKTQWLYMTEQTTTIFISLLSTTILQTQTPCLTKCTLGGFFPSCFEKIPEPNPNFIEGTVT